MIPIVFSHVATFEADHHKLLLRLTAVKLLLMDLQAR